MQTKLNLAKKIRRTVEKHAKQISHVNNPNTLSCLCAISSYCLAHVFHDTGFSAKIIHGFYQSMTDGWKYTHVWLESEAEIFDITATQFDQTHWQPNPRVLRTPLDDKRFIKYWEIQLDEVERYFVNWPKDQQPVCKNVDVILNDFYDRAWESNKC